MNDVSRKEAFVQEIIQGLFFGKNYHISLFLEPLASLGQGMPLSQSASQLVTKSAGQGRFRQILVI